MTCECKTGLSVLENECIDIDECSSDTSCDPNADCIDIHGSYICHCKDGFVGNGHHCHNKTTEIDVCQMEDFCIDGDCYDEACHCSNGFTLKDNRCIDERCDSACPSDAVCSTSSGSTVCSCPTGTSMSSDGSQCLDIDECSENYDDCQLNSLCMNVYGSYQCQCPSEYLDVFGDGKICINVEPTSCNLTCPVGQYCQNNACTCLEDLIETDDENGINCEKETPSCNPNTCPPNATCQERLFGFLCHCASGYDSVGLKSCEDSDECNLNTHSCSANETCTNTAGSFTCSCKPSYTREDSTGACIFDKICNCGSNGLCSLDGKCKCKSGFELNTDGSCDDIDECQRGTPCHLLAKCTNTPGSYICSCPNNFYGDPKTRCIEDKCATKQLICADGEECTQGLYSSVCIKKLCKSDEIIFESKCVPATKACQTKVCAVNAICKIMNNRTDCFCDSGYFGDGDSCVDVDECSSGLIVCPRKSHCQNKPGSYYCGCDQGFKISENSYSTDEYCVDIDECRVPNACAANSKCTNQEGSFNCQCNDGFIGDGRYGCRLDAKCKRYNHCNSNAACILDDKTATYVCKCSSGYSGDGINSCIKDNLCSVNGRSKCHPNGQCFQANSTYRCICKTGFQGDGYNFCSDIDECAQSSTNVCLPAETCVNVKGGYFCNCGNGAEVVNDICQDIDECNGTRSSNCSQNAVCQNKLNGYLCKCKDGFYGDGVTCHDIDECSLGTANCSSQALCINKPGKFDCECQAGTMGNGTTCVDVDECTKQNITGPQCDNNATCKNKKPGYECKCNKGYTGTGWYCVKENPCNTPNVCSVNETCSPSDTNEVAICKCKDDFVSNNGACVPIKACETGQATCNKNTEDCIQLDRGYICQCKSGFKDVGNGCEDKNECDPQSPDFTAQECAASGGGCINTHGSFICTCNKQQMEDGAGCKPIDSCAMKLDNCDKNVENCVDNGNSGYSCQCIEGYTKVNGSCTDIDECKNDTHECRKNATCINNIGSYNCSCPDGLELDESQTSCKDRNECFENPFICGDFAKCVNNEGSYSCVCVKGYVWNGTSCEDIDECKNLTNPCHKYADCSNIPGSCTCKCRPGYDGDGIYKCEESDECPPDVQVSCLPGTYCTYNNGIATCKCRTGYTFIGTISCNETVCLNLCDDINECVTKKSACHRLAQCTNNDGAYVCQCPSYLTGDGKTICEDKDECVLGEHMCDLNTSSCVNNNNTVDILHPFQCDCFNGYIKIPGTQLCVDQNECLNPNENDCESNSDCFNTVGSYECKCKVGFKAGPARRCIDIDECDQKTYTCDLHSKCNNTVGSYKCDCDSGYQLSSNESLICEDINECINPMTCQHISNSMCINNPGHYECVCPDGFTQENGNCTDIDECKNPSACKNGSDCVNILGYFQCQCTNITRPLPDGSCESINECMEGIDQCETLNGPNSTCYDLPVGYGCSCPRGFIKSLSSPSLCIDFDECSMGTNNCSAGKSTCHNTFGGFQCTCNQGFTLSANNTCEDINECAIGVSIGKSICGKGKCVNNAGGYSCECDSGFMLVKGRCVDIDECNADRNSIYADTCDIVNGQCSNTPGSYNCKCQKGYEMVDNSSKCQDVNECNYPNSCVNGICNNKQGSFECTCLDGFQNKNGKCEDINECAQIPGRCGISTASVCINTFSSYKCLCSQGYENSGGKITNICLPINECIRLNVTCPPNAQCMDLDLGYLCTCKDGYNEDQIGICRNINECQIESSCHYLASCIDTEGSYECKCKPGFKGNGKTSCISICDGNSCPPNKMCRVVNVNQFECGCFCQGPQCLSNEPVCDKFGVTYTSQMIMMETACKQNITTEVEYFHECKDSCSKVICPNTEVCTMVNSRPSCSCSECTPQELIPSVLCSTNGIQFQSICQMKAWICETRSLIKMSYYGPCRRPIDCELSDWTEWSGCTKTCGIGKSSRYRSVIKNAKFNGECETTLLETQSCYDGPCPGDACENLTCNPGSLCDSGKCFCPDCSGITISEPVCGKIGDIEAGTYRTFCTLQHNACMLNASFTYIHKGQCGDHIPSEPKICTVVTNFQIVNNTNNCTSVEPVRTNLCSGGCGLNAEYCCRPIRGTILRVKFRCQDNSFIFDEVISIASCECKLKETSTLAP